MGGLGSGGWGIGEGRKKKHRRTVESCLVLDVNDLSARGCFQPGLFSTCQWLDGSGGIFSIRLRYEAGRLFLSYDHQAGGGEPAEEVTWEVASFDPRTSDWEKCERAPRHRESTPAVF